MKCLFCHRDDQKTSREHIISKPIAQLIGVSRDRDLLAAVDSDGRLRIPPVPFASHAVRGPCDDCNHGWMQELDRAAAATIRSAETLLESDVQVLQSWLLKMYYVFGLRDDSFQNPFAGADLVSHLVPDPAQSKALRDGDYPRALGYSIVGFGRSRDDWPVTGFGNCRSNPRRLLIFAGALVLGLPAVNAQLWLVNPVLPVNRVELPPGVTQLRPGSAWEERGHGSFPSPDRVTVHFIA